MQKPADYEFETILVNVNPLDIVQNCTTLLRVLSSDLKNVTTSVSVQNIYGTSISVHDGTIPQRNIMCVLLARGAAVRPILT